MDSRVVTFLILFAGACSSNDGAGTATDVTGTYTGPVTNRGNSCPGTWMTGQTSEAVATVVQTGANVSIQVQGAAGLALQIGFGTNSFSGTVSGNHIDALIIGSVQASAGGCRYTSDGNLVADLAGNTLTGTITYTPKTNAHADCTTMLVTGCSSQQTFALNRPPKTP